jgi:hypothetical protein
MVSLASSRGEPVERLVQVHHQQVQAVGARRHLAQPGRLVARLDVRRRDLGAQVLWRLVRRSGMRGSSLQQAQVDLEPVVGLEGLAHARRLQQGRLAEAGHGALLVHRRASVAVGNPESARQR